MMYLFQRGGGVIDGDLTVNGDLTVGSRKMGEQKLLWSGYKYMNSDHTITLSEAVSQQPNGIVLVWSYYSDGAASDKEFNCYFIPKKMVSLHSGSSYQCHVNASDTASNKVINVTDTSIIGHAWNYSNDINKYFVLRYVIGV